MTIDVSTLDATPGSAEHVSGRYGDSVEGSPQSIMGDDEGLARCAPVRIGDYELREFLGRGGMGRVYRYRDTKLGRDVAIKFLLRADGRAEHLLREACTIAKVEHPNVLKVHTAEEAGGIPFIVSEYIEGRSLAEVKSVGCWRRVLQWALDLARGLAAAHEMGIVHGDIKPANALLDERRNIVKLIDFGLARYADAAQDGESLTCPIDALPAPLRGERASHERRIQGTCGYMAPEMRRGQRASKRSDVYAFGKTLYELCTGDNLRAGMGGARRRFHGRVTKGRRAVDVISMDALSEIPAALGAIIQRCLSPEPEYRYESARPLLRALEALSHRRAWKQDRRLCWLAMSAPLMVALTLSGALSIGRTGTRPQQADRHMAEAEMDVERTQPLSSEDLVAGGNRITAHRSFIGTNDSECVQVCRRRIDTQPRSRAAGRIQVRNTQHMPARIFHHGGGASIAARQPSKSSKTLDVSDRHGEQSPRFRIIQNELANTTGL